MTAPALILLAHGAAEQHMTSSLHEIRKQMQQARPELHVSLAFLDHCPPSGPTVVQALVQRGVREMVFVPLEVSHAVEVEQSALDMLERVRAAHPEVAFGMARPLGPATDLLNVLDDRLRDALRQAHSIEVDALVLSTEAAGDTRGSALVARRARQWASHHKLPCVVAVGDGSGASVAQAIATLRAQGRRHIAVGSFFVAGSQAYQAQRETALATGVEAVSAPMGAHDYVLDLVMARYVFAAMELLDAEVVAATEQTGDVHELQAI